MAVISAMSMAAPGSTAMAPASIISMGSCRRLTRGTRGEPRERESRSVRVNIAWAGREIMID